MKWRKILQVQKKLCSSILWIRKNLNQATISLPNLNMPVTQFQQQVYTDFSSHVIILWSYSRYCVYMHTDLPTHVYRENIGIWLQHLICAGASVVCFPQHRPQQVLLQHHVVYFSEVKHSFYHRNPCHWYSAPTWLGMRLYYTGSVKQCVKVLPQSKLSASVRAQCVQQ